MPQICQNLKNLSHYELLRLFSHELSGKYSTKQYQINPVYLYRGRVNYDYGESRTINSFSHVKQLWAPPPKHAKENRCNLRGESFLYCSAHPSTIFFEIPIEANQSVTIIIYKVEESLKLLSAIGAKRLKATNKHYLEIFKSHFENSFPETEAIDDLLSAIFQTKINDDNKGYLYKITNAITRLFLFRNNQNMGWVGYPHVPSIGLVYPSVRTDIPNVNFALKPNYARNLLKPIEVYKYKVVKKRNENHLDLLLTDKASKIFQGGEIRWRKIQREVEHISHLKEYTDG